MSLNRSIILRCVALSTVLLTEGCNTSSGESSLSLGSTIDLSGKTINFNYVTRASNNKTGKTSISHINSALRVLKDGNTYLFFAEGNHRKATGVEIKSVGKWYSHTIDLPTFGAPNEYRAKVARSGNRMRLEVASVVKYGMSGAFTLHFSFIFDVKDGGCAARFVSYRASGQGARGVSVSPQSATCSIK